MTSACNAAGIATENSERWYRKCEDSRIFPTFAPQTEYTDKMKTYRTYLFDFDYTLADSSKGIVMCYRIVLERHGHTGFSDGDIKRTIGKTLVESFSILSGVTDAGILETYRKEYVKEADK